MNIVYISREYPESLRGGGIASYLKIIAEGMVSRGHHVTVIAANDDTRFTTTSEINGVNIIRLSKADFIINSIEPNFFFYKKFRFLYRFRSYRKQVRTWVKRIKDIDIIEVADYGAEGLYLNDLGVPVVYRLHTPSLLNHRDFSISTFRNINPLYYSVAKKELKIISKHARYITSCSTSLKEWVNKYVNTPCKDIKVIFNPINPAFNSIEMSRINQVNNVTVFFAGTMCNWKGVDDLYEACKIIRKNNVNIQLTLAGKNSLFGESLFAKARNEGNDWVEYLGKVSQDKLAEYYSSSDVVCFPSWWENMPMVCIEAMACGGIVVGSNSGGMAEIIEDGQSGFLITPKDPLILANKIMEVVSLSDETKHSVRKNAIKRISEEFSLDSILDKTLNYFHELINNYDGANKS